MIIYGKYGGAALRAVHLMTRHNYDHVTAWDLAISEAFGEEISSKKVKNNPKTTFLTLCSLGAVGCVMPIQYDAAQKTRHYVQSALSLLAGKDPVRPIDPNHLWQDVIEQCALEKTLRHNNQMDVVLTLWYANILNLDARQRDFVLDGELLS